MAIQAAAPDRPEPSANGPRAELARLAVRCAKSPCEPAASGLAASGRVDEGTDAGTISLAAPSVNALPRARRPRTPPVPPCASASATELEAADLGAHFAPLRRGDEQPDLVEEPGARARCRGHAAGELQLPAFDRREHRDHAATADHHYAVHGHVDEHVVRIGDAIERRELLA